MALQGEKVALELVSSSTQHRDIALNCLQALALLALSDEEKGPLTQADARRRINALCEPWPRGPLVHETRIKTGMVHRPGIPGGIR